MKHWYLAFLLLVELAICCTAGVSQTIIMDELHISVPANRENKTVSCQLLNTDGRLIKTFTIQQTATIGMSAIPTGTYYVKMIDGNETSIQTIIKRNSR